MALWCISIANGFELDEEREEYTEAYLNGILESYGRRLVLQYERYKQVSFASNTRV